MTIRITWLRQLWDIEIFGATKSRFFLIVTEEYVMLFDSYYTDVHIVTIFKKMISFYDCLPSASCSSPDSIQKFLNPPLDVAPEFLRLQKERQPSALWKEKKFLYK